MSKVKQVQYFFNKKESNGVTELVISGAIGESGWWGDATSADDVRKALEGVSGDIRILLNSSGGDVFQGIEIYNFLRSLENRVTVKVTALAASAASIIAMGADEVIMETGSSMMIHEASTFAYGNKNDIRKTLNALETIDNSIIDIYFNKTGIDREKLINYVNSETWFTADEAVDLGFANKVDSSSDDVASISVSDEIISKLINSSEFASLVAKNIKFKNVYSNDDSNDSKSADSSGFFIF